MLHTMIIMLTLMHQLETLYQYPGVKGQSGVIWGHKKAAAGYMSSR